MAVNRPHDIVTRHVILVLVFLLTACQGTASTPTIAPLPVAHDDQLPENFLHAEGRNIVNEQGEVVLLRGINFDNFYTQYRWTPTALDNYASPEDFQRLAALGVNVVRVAIHWEFLESDLAFDLIDGYTETASEIGIYLIIDMHVVPPDEYVGGAGIWPDLSAQQRFIELWQRIAYHYRDEPVIAGYDLFHEPNPPVEDDWWSLAKRIIEGIRTVDPNHIIFLQRPIIPDASFQRVSDPNVVYSFHDYEPLMVTYASSEWLSDIRLADYFSYPGEVLTDMTLIGQAEEAVPFTAPGNNQWLQWESGELTPPPDAEWATVVLFGRGDIGDTYMDDVELYVNSQLYQIPNSGFEIVSPGASNRPTGWHVNMSEDGAYVINRVPDADHDRNGYGLEIRGRGEWIELHQGAPNLLTEEYIPVPPSSTFRLSIWLNPLHNRGDLGVTLNWHKATYEYYDANRLRANILPYVEWAHANNVPLWVGEFGAMRAAPGFSSRRLISDKITLYNEYGLGWALWTYRESEYENGFGLYSGPIEKTTEHSRLNESLYRVLVDGWGDIP